MHFLTVVCLLLASFFCSSRVDSAEDPIRVGVLVGHAGRVVLAAGGAEIAPGTRVYPVEAKTIPRVSVRRRLPAASEASPGPLVLVADTPVPVYATGLPENIDFDHFPLVVTLGQAPPPGLSVSSCTSAEGIHISLWSGSGAERIRRWSAYVYLGYDTEPTCSDSELAS